MSASRHSLSPLVITPANKLLRGLWSLAWLLLFRPTPRPFHAWRCMLLRLFGARLEPGVKVYESVRIWAPWNLEMKAGSCLGDDVNCYNVARVTLHERAVVSQYSYLCTASHDYTLRSHPLMVAPITLGTYAWVTADVFVGPGVVIGEGSVVAARSTVVRDVPPWMVVGGNPVQILKQREFKD